jgi:hydrogenase-4 component F
MAKVAFVFVLIGYGTKVGLAPMHTWKPDAYSKSPAPVGALFSGALMPVAFLTILKFRTLTDVAVGKDFSSHLLIVFGLLSIIVAAFSILSTKNYKRALAYSSIEHSGLMALGFGFGGLGALAAVLHMIYHSLIKSSLFFLSGNILIKFNSARIAKVRGTINVIPITASLFLLGLLAALGLPPFGIFLTEISMMSAGVKHYLPVVIVAVVAMAVLFVAFLRHATNMLYGEKPEDIVKGERSLWLLVPPVILLSIAFIAAFYVPEFIQTLISQAASR